LCMVQACKKSVARPTSLFQNSCQPRAGEVMAGNTSVPVCVCVLLQDACFYKNNTGGTFDFWIKRGGSLTMMQTATAMP
jgi:hypothetical protein